MTKYAGRTAVLRVGDGGDPTEVFSTVPQVGSIDAFGSSRDLIDASAYGDDWKDYVLGQQDGAEIGVGLQLDPNDTVHTALDADYAAATRRNFKIDFGAGETPAAVFSFTAIITELTRTPALDGMWEANMTLKIVNPGVSQGAT